MEHDDRGSSGRHRLLAGLILALGVTGALLTLQVPAFFGPDGGNPVVAGALSVVLVVLAVAMRIVRPSDPA